MAGLAEQAAQLVGEVGLGLANSPSQRLSVMQLGNEVGLMVGAGHNIGQKHGLMKGVASGISLAAAGPGLIQAAGSLVYGAMTRSQSAPAVPLAPPAVAPLAAAAVPLAPPDVPISSMAGILSSAAPVLGQLAPLLGPVAAVGATLYNSSKQQEQQRSQQQEAAKIGVAATRLQEIGDQLGVSIDEIKNAVYAESYAGSYDATKAAIDEMMKKNMKTPKVNIKVTKPAKTDTQSQSSTDIALTQEMKEIYSTAVEFMRRPDAQNLLAFVVKMQDRDSQHTWYKGFMNRVGKNEPAGEWLWRTMVAKSHDEVGRLLSLFQAANAT